jgi:hypothetical protein
MYVAGLHCAINFNLPWLLATTLQDVRLELVKEDLRLAAQGEISAHQTSLTSFLMTGLELEEQQ